MPSSTNETHVEYHEEPRMITTLETETVKEESIKSKVAKLIDVKSIITILLTLCFIYTVIVSIQNEKFVEIYGMIIVFYFGTQAVKK